MSVVMWKLDVFLINCLEALFIMIENKILSGCF